MAVKKSENANSIKTARIRSIVEGKVVGKGKAAVYFDLGPLGAGVIYGREFYEAKKMLKELKEGDAVLAKITGEENEEGYVELSLAKASKEIAWETLKQRMDKEEVFLVKILGANKGGLLAKVSGIPAFLPSSQLSSANYPKIEDGDNQKILKALQKLVGRDLEVRVFDLDPREEKLILSEKTKEDQKVKEAIKQFSLGDIVEGEITGVVKFGAFIKFPPKEPGELECLEGLIHISELDWQLIADPLQIVQIGQKVKAKIIDISNGKVSLSLKATKTDPWSEISLNKGDIVKGKVTKFNPYGAFIQIIKEENKEGLIQGLCHISEFGTREKMEEALKIEQEYNFQILAIEPKEHKMSLRLTENK